MKKKTCRVAYLAVKLDLKKAYDRVSWTFLKNVLVVGLETNLVELIMHTVTSASLAFIWNGEVTEDFKLTRGLRQGDSLSPYLFVLCMEVRGQWIIEAEKARATERSASMQRWPKNYTSNFCG